LDDQMAEREMLDQRSAKVCCSKVGLVHRDAKMANEGRLLRLKIICERNVDESRAAEARRNCEV